MTTGFDQLINLSNPTAFSSAATMGDLGQYLPLAGARSMRGPFNTGGHPIIGPDGVSITLDLTVTISNDGPGSPALGYQTPMTVVIEPTESGAIINLGDHIQLAESYPPGGPDYYRVKLLDGSDAVVFKAESGDFANNVLIGAGYPLGVAVTSPAGVIHAADTSTSTTARGIILDQHTADAIAPMVLLRKSRHATIGSHTVVQSADYVGGVIAMGSDGTNFENAAAVLFAVDNTPGNDDMPGRIEFHTTADGAKTLSERMRITAAGVVAITGTGSSTSPILTRNDDADTGVSFTSADVLDLIAGGVQMLSLIESTNDQIALGPTGSTTVPSLSWVGDLNTGLSNHTADTLGVIIGGTERLTVDDTTRMSGAWTSYTPTMTASTTNPTLGNGTLVGAYTKVGRSVTVRIHYIFGSTSTAGSGNYSWALPVTAASGTVPTSPVVVVVGAGMCRDLTGSTYTYQLGIHLATTTTIQAWWDIGARGSTGWSLLGHAGTINWITGNWFSCTFTYEAAS